MKTKTGLGRGLSSLIPDKNDKPVQAVDGSKEKVSELDSVLEVAIDQVHHNPRQPRQNFSSEDLEDLVGSIKQHGILQPLLVSVRDDGQYELIAGERRLRSAKEAGLSKVPVVARSVNDQEKLELALIENIQRQDLNALEEAVAYKSLIDEFEMTQEEVARRVGKARPTVANTVRLLDLPEEMQDALREGKLSRSHARTLLAEDDQEKQKQLFQAILGGGVTVREIEARTENKLRASRRRSRSAADISAAEAQLQDILGTKVNIQEKDGQGKILIDFYSREDLKKILNRFQD